MPLVLKCHKGLGPTVTGTALVAQDNFSTRYELDRIKGVLSRAAHNLLGQSYVDRVLLLVTAEGGVRAPNAGRPVQSGRPHDPHSHWRPGPDRAAEGVGYDPQPRGLGSLAL